MVEPTNLKPFTLSIYPPIRLDLKQLAMSIVYVVNRTKTYFIKPASVRRLLLKNWNLLPMLYTRNKSVVAHDLMLRWPYHSKSLRTLHIGLKMGEK